MGLRWKFDIAITRVIRKNYVFPVKLVTETISVDYVGEYTNFEPDEDFVLFKTDGYGQVWIKDSRLKIWHIEDLYDDKGELTNVGGVNKCVNVYALIN